LSRNGAGDADEDGVTDIEEYQSGANPLDPLPLRILNASLEPNRSLTVTWRSIPGASYLPQYKTTLTQTGWTDLGTPILATESETSFTDKLSTVSVRRFYRVIVYRRSF
jgi:hypothetical protein